MAHIRVMKNTHKPIRTMSSPSSPSSFSLSIPSTRRTTTTTWHHHSFSLLSLCFLVLVFLNPRSISCDRTKAKIYVNLLEAKGCFRRMNADGVVGCQSSFNGDVGVVHIVRPKNAADLDYVLSKGPYPPYVPILSPWDFTKTKVERLIASHSEGRISGIVVNGNDTSDVDAFSGDAACPNHKFGLYSEDEHCHQWNAPGSGLMLKSFPFPVFLVGNEEDLSNLTTQCFGAFNDPGIAKNKPAVSYPLCGIELHSFMYGSVSSKRCLRRSTKLDISAGAYDQQCDPLGDKNVFGFLHDPKSPSPSNSSLVMVTARLDSTGFFEEVYPGANSPASGIVALLATAHTLKKVEAKISKSSKNVLFTLFEGETFDYLGSNRVVYDMTSDSSSRWPVDATASSPFVPVEMRHLSHVIELAQFASSSSSAYLFTDKKASTESGNETETLVRGFLDVGAKISGLKVAKAADVEVLPPASLQQFLKARRDLPGIVVAEHEGTFTNKYYNSFMDSSAKISDRAVLSANLAKVATLTARSILQLTTGTDDENLKADDSVVDQLVHCFVYDTNCTLFKAVFGTQQKVDTVNEKKFLFSYYVGVLRSQNLYRHLSSLILAYFIGNVDDAISHANCTGEMQNWMLLGGNGSCVSSFVGVTEAASPAIDPLIDNIMFSFDDDKAKTSAVWTESIWSPKTLTARIFLIPSTTRQVVILVIGILEFLFFMILMYFASKRCEILFNIDTSTQQALTTSHFAG